MAPFHPAGENPTLALQRDLELIQHLDRLGYDEAWIGEHHSAGSEIIASYRAAVPANTMGGGALRRLAVETACGLPNMTSALNRGATHRARYTDPDGAVTEVVVAAQDCDY